MDYGKDQHISSYLSDADLRSSPEEIGKRIRSVRKSLHMTQEQLAKSLNVSCSYISFLEAGTRNLTHQITMPLLRVLNITYEYLLTGSTIRGPGNISALCESSSYHSRLKLEKLIQSCTKAEYEMCFELCNTYLKTSRIRKSMTPESDSEVMKKSKYGSDGITDHVSK